jgi:Transglycosylase
MKFFKRVSILLLVSLLCCALWFLCWLFNPLDKSAWRIAVPLPVIGTVHVRAWPLIQLATSSTGRNLVNHTQWQTQYGRVKLENKAGLLQINCTNCQLKLNELSSKAIMFDEVSFSVRRINEQLSGVLEIVSDKKPIRVLYTAVGHNKGIDLNWSLPSTAIADLLTPLKTHSTAIQKAHVTGTLAANGTLHWPSRLWSAKPVIENFDVTGLGTEKLKTAQVKYLCPSTSQNAINNGINSQAWLNKKELGRWLPISTIIAEDAQFMHHHGYDFETLSYLLAQENSNKQLGGSTITQQLAKYFFTGGERQWKRKIEELLYAVEMENTLGKNRILNLYLNTLDWGPGICGASDASQFYFATKPKQLTPIQAAWLAGIIRNPHRAWSKQYQTNQPDYKRIQEITRFMPARIRALPIKLTFTNPSN